MTKEELREEPTRDLNDDLASEYQAVLMYTTYSATVTGPHRPMMREFLAPRVPEELAHAQFLADKIASLGGEPVSLPREVLAASSPREMLENVLTAEKHAIEDYWVRAEQATAVGDKGLVTYLESSVEDETAHFEETAKFLRGWGA